MTRVVTIVLNAQGEKTDLDKRFRSTQRLVSYLKEHYERKEILKDQNIQINDKSIKLMNQFILGCLKTLILRNYVIL